MPGTVDAFVAYLRAPRGSEEEERTSEVVEQLIASNKVRVPMVPEWGEGDEGKPAFPKLKWPGKTTLGRRGRWSGILTRHEQIVRWRVKNKARRAEMQRAWKAAHPDKIKAYNAARTARAQQARLH